MCLSRWIFRLVWWKLFQTIAYGIIPPEYRSLPYIFLSKARAFVNGPFGQAKAIFNFYQEASKSWQLD